MQKNALLRFSLYIAFILIGAGCQTKPEYIGVRFIQATHDISSSFISENGTLYIVPEKGVVIDKISTAEGVDINWVTSGSYIVVRSVDLNGVNSIDLLIEGRKRNLVLKSKVK